MQTFIKNYYWPFHAAACLAALLLAFAFQYIGNLSPCTLCIWQRWPYVAAIIVALLIKRKSVLSLCYFIGFSLAAFHVGVEQGWWEGLSSCSAAAVDSESVAAVLAAIENTPLTKCNEVQWSLLGLSMAAWNGLLNIFLLAMVQWPKSFKN